MNGFQVAPAEMEAVLLRHPAVLDCAVFGVADERAGEVPVAAVAARPGPAGGRWRAAAAGGRSLATYKQLRHLVVVETIPRLPSGKVLRRTLRDEWAASARRRGPRPDGRPALARAAGAARLGGPARRPARARTVADLDDPERAGQARRCRGRRRLAGAADVAGDDAPRWPRGWRSASWPRSWAGDWPTWRSSGRPWPASCGGWPGAAGRRARDGALEPRPVVGARRGHRRRGAAGRGRRRPRDRRRALVLVGRADGGRVAQVGLGPAVAGGRSHPPVGGARSGRPSPVAGATRPSPTTTWTGGRALGLAAGLRRSGRRHARCGGAGRRLRRRAPAVRRGHRLLPGRPAPAGRRLRLTEGSRERHPACGLGRRRAPAGRGAGRGGGGQGLLRPGRPRGVRDRDPGARRHRQHLGVPGPRLPPARACCRATCLGDVGPSLARVLDAPRDRRAAMDFGDSPAEAEFRLRLRELAGGQQPGPAGLVDRRRVLGGHGGVAPVALRRRLLRHVVAHGHRRARPADRVSR